MATRTVALNRRKRKKKVFLAVPTRILLILLLLLAGLIWVTVRLFIIQIFQRQELNADQLNQLVDEVQVAAERGNIYDRNMNVLVADSSAKSVNLIPKQVEDRERVAQVISEKLGVDYDKVYAITGQLENDKVQVVDNIVGKDMDALMKTLNNDEAYVIENGAFYVRPEKVKNAKSDAKAIALALDLEEEDALEFITSRENTTVLVKNKVDNQLAKSVQDELKVTDENGEVKATNGVELLEDKKRYYTNGNFASQILGFTGSDHEGLYGVEKAFNETLSGTKGIVYYQKDGQGNIITSESRMIQESKKGEDLVLSIDSNIQSATEKALEKTVGQWQAKKGMAIVMNCKTGEIVSMASKPDYNLNDPYILSAAEKGLSDKEKSAILEERWKNPAVSFIYEPGSTFKPITVSVALEEGAITPDTHFNCTGSINVQGTTINCTGVHGDQTIEQILENSCNPGLVQIIGGVDPNDFYKYVYNYGFGQKTGIELTGEEDGIVNRVFLDDGSIKMVDYSTFSFGQGLATTPIQIITALNAVVNGGNYLKPTILKSDEQISPKQIISSSTSSTLRQEMRSVVRHNPALENSLGGYEIGGKTGTAEKFVDGSYSSGKYVCSFFCFSPIDDPQYCAMVIIDEPKDGASGAGTAAPAAIDILKQTLIYTGANPNEGEKVQMVIPECTGKQLTDVERILHERGILYSISQDSQGSIVTGQSIPAQTPYEDGQELVLTLGEPENVQVPDFVGLTQEEAQAEADKAGISVNFEGTGKVSSQSRGAGESAAKGESISLKLEE